MKEIKGYEGLYSITEDGQVYSHRRKIYLATRPDRDGYLRTNLSKDGKAKTVFIHRLVAEAYIPNPDNLPYVDHIDRNVANNAIENLRWVTESGNSRNSRKNRKVINLDINELFNSIADAAETIKDQFKNFQSARSSIYHCCTGRSSQCAGMRWAYADNYSTKV